MRTELQLRLSLSVPITVLLLAVVLVCDAVTRRSIEEADELHELRMQQRKEVKDIQRQICVKGEENATSILLSKLQCVEHHAPRGSQPAMQAIWIDVIGTEYPVTQRQWKDFICGTRDFQLKKDLVDVAFLLRESAHDDSLQVVKDQIRAYDMCEHINRTVDMMFSIHSKRSWDRNQQTIASLVNNFATLLHRATGLKVFHNSSGITGSEDTFSEAVDKCDTAMFNASDSYCLQRREYSLNVTQVCTHRNASFISDLVHQHRCLERRSSRRMIAELRSCWKLVTGTDYPANDQDFVKFACIHRYPLSVRRIVDNCYYERLSGRYISSGPTRSVFVQNRANLTNAENERPCSMPVWRESDIQMTAVYRMRYNKYRTRYQVRKTCVERDIRMAKDVIRDVRCPEYRMDRKMGVVLRFCWDYSAGVEYPKYTDQWMSLLCHSSRRQLRSIAAKVNACIRAGPSLIFGHKYSGTIARIVDKEFEQRIGSCSTVIPFSDRDIQIEGS